MLFDGPGDCVRFLLFLELRGGGEGDCGTGEIDRVRPGVAVGLSRENQQCITARKVYFT